MKKKSDFTLTLFTAWENGNRSQVQPAGSLGRREEEKVRGVGAMWGTAEEILNLIGKGESETIEFKKSTASLPDRACIINLCG